MTNTERTWMEVQMVMSHVAGRSGRLRGDRGEGVISTAIAVLIIAFLGAAMWVGFNTIWENSEDNINDQVNEIGT